MAALAGLVSSLVGDSSVLGQLASLSSEQIRLLFVGQKFYVGGFSLISDGYYRNRKHAQR